MTPMDDAWLVLKALEPAMQDDANMPEEDMRHYQNMQNMLDINTLRGNTNPSYIQQNSGAKPAPMFTSEFAAMNPWMESANLEHQADTSRNPADARNFKQMAAEANTRNSPTEPPSTDTEEEVDFMTELKRILDDAQRRSIVPNSYRRKVRPVTDQEVSRSLNKIRGYRR